MARVTLVAKAQKDQGKCSKCGAEIKLGEPYKWFKNRIGRSSIRRVFCAGCSIRPSDMTTSSKLSDLYLCQETLEDAISEAATTEDLTAALNTAADSAREVAEAYRDSVQNMPENLQQSSTASEMEDKADNIESWADELSAAADEIEADPWEPEDGSGEETEAGESKEDGSEDAKEGKEESGLDSERRDDQGRTEDEHLEHHRSQASDVCSDLSI